MSANLAAAVVMVGLCAAGPAIVGVVAGGVVGGRLGAFVACAVAALIGVVVYRRRGRAGC
jgi:hypothetical protein